MPQYSAYYYDKEYFLIAPLFGALGAVAAIVFTGQYKLHTVTQSSFKKLYFSYRISLRYSKMYDWNCVNSSEKTSVNIKIYGSYDYGFSHRNLWPCGISDYC